MCHSATSPSGRAAHDAGGGTGAACSPNLPATTVTWPSPSTGTLGIWLSQNIEKCGCTNLSLAGRLIQIWKSSSGFGPPTSSSGNISACTMPRPAVIHWTSPRP